MDEGFTDLWTLDVANIKWTLVASGAGPKRAWGHVAAWDSTSVGIHAFVYWMICLCTESNKLRQTRQTFERAIPDEFLSCF